MSTISASTTSTTAYKVTADTTGTLVFQTGATPTTAMTLGSDQSVTFAGTPTYSGGTANGVAYLNGSKVLTTGSALVFDGTNLGVGVTPSAWAVGWSALQTGYYAAFGASVAGAVQSFMSSNAYYSSGSWKGGLTGSNASLYEQIAGSHRWNIASSVTAGTNFTFTQAMTLDVSGNLIVGDTSAVGKLNAITTSGLAGFFKSASGTAEVNIAQFSNNTNGAYVTVSAAGSASNVTSWNNGSMILEAVPYNSGNFILDSYTGSLVLQTGRTERARIDSSGNLLVGTTTSSALLYRYSSSTTFTGSTIRAEVNTAAGTGWLLFEGVNTATTCFKVFGNGNVQNTNNSYGAISDVKLKENITDATPKLAQLNQIRVVNYNLIGDENKQLGVIAQELEQVFPSMVEESPDRDEEGNDLGTTTKSVKYSVFVPMLIKAIQEQQALIQQLQADVATLKGTA